MYGAETLHCPYIPLVFLENVYTILGVWINQDLKWPDHVNDIVSKVSHQLRLMRRLAGYSLGRLQAAPLSPHSSFLGPPLAMGHTLIPVASYNMNSIRTYG